MAVYTSVGGANRELSSLHGCAGSVNRNLSSFQACVGGVNRELLRPRPLTAQAYSILTQAVFRNYDGYGELQNVPDYADERQGDFLCDVDATGEILSTTPVTYGLYAPNGVVVMSYNIEISVKGADPSMPFFIEFVDGKGLPSGYGEGGKMTIGAETFRVTSSGTSKTIEIATSWLDSSGNGTFYIEAYCGEIVGATATWWNSLGCPSLRLSNTTKGYAQWNV